MSHFWKGFEKQAEITAEDVKRKALHMGKHIAGGALGGALTEAAFEGGLGLFRHGLWPEVVASYAMKGIVPGLVGGAMIGALTGSFTHPKED